MKPNTAADACICGQSGEHAAVFQLVPAGFGVLGHKAVIFHQPGKRAQTAAGAHKPIEHGACCQHVHRFLAPAAPDFQIAQTLRQRNAEVHVVQRNVALVILVFGNIAALVVVVGVGKVPQLVLFFRRQALHIAKI